MKTFWSVVLVLVACAVAYVVASPSRENALATAPSDASNTVPAPVATATQNAPAIAPEPPDYPRSDSIADTLIGGDWSDVGSANGSSSSSPTPNAAPPATKQAPPAPAPPAPAPAAEPDRGYSIAKGVITKRDDGTLLVDNRIVIKGDGTKEHPYEITWDLLTAAELTFDPKVSSKKIPEGVALLDGKRVRVKGFLAFPLYVQEPTEVLAMLNQWDGCCMGVPPTPYDAIEVRLAKPVKGNDRYANSGVVEGTFGIKPYVTGKWLVGLYVMNQASILPEGSSSSPSTQGK